MGSTVLVMWIGVVAVVLIGLGGVLWIEWRDRRRQGERKREEAANLMGLESALWEKLAGMFPVEHRVEPDPVREMLAQIQTERSDLVATMAEITKQAQEQAVRVVEAFGKAISSANGYDQEGLPALSQEIIHDPIMREVLWPANETDAAEDQSWASMSAEPPVGLPRWDDLGIDPPVGELPGEDLG